jgi:hypothetical protein
MELCLHPESQVQHRGEKERREKKNGQEKIVYTHIRAVLFFCPNFGGSKSLSPSFLLLSLFG